ncbi:hypothetical protein EYR36_001644 [Pleurotus pulmonarius]|nr:hypothetical protein EYR36_008413 [Pleurotus pulmonarius]KAF4579824.1 hypothetical protein EYR36_001644 [Pleurotus pulmonarius]
MSERALNAILPLISKSPYEAHQKARTFAARYNKSGQYSTAIDVLFQSARELLKAGQTGSGVDLAGFLLDVYETSGQGVTDESKGRLTQLIALTGSAGSWRKTIIDKAIAWSAKHGACPAGDPDLHHYVGELMFKEGSYATAEPHFLTSGKRDSARLLAEMFYQWATSTGGPYGPFALRGVIPYLLNGNILAARTFITHFISLLPSSLHLPAASPIPVKPSSEVVLTTEPVLNFAQIAVLTCQRAQGDKNKAMREAWVRLCGTYQSKGGLLALPEVRRSLSELGTLYFAIPQPRSQAANPLGDMLASMFGGPPPTQPTRRVLKPATPSSSGLD